MPALLETRDLCKHYQMGASIVRALDGVSLTVAAGEFVGLLGTSGSGKSTLLNLVAGLDRPSSGSLRVFDQDLATMTSDQLSVHRQKNVGIIFQSFNLVSTMSAAENVALAMMFAGVPRGERDGKASRLLDTVGLAEIMALLKALNERGGKTIIMVTHDPALARQYAHRTITMLDGAVVDS